jgi:hypothetical protein
MNINEKRKMLMGLRGLMIPIPRMVSDKGLEKGVAGAEAKAARLSEDERRIHHHIVWIMPTASKPIEALQVSEALELPLNMVAETIDKLEEMKTFLFRTDGQGIDWAYPVSMEDTGHEVRCSTGELFNAA